MSYRGHASWLVLAVTIAVSRGLSGAQELPTGANPELRVLDRFVGTWDIDISVKPGVFVRNGAKARGVTTNAWVENGRRMRQTWSVESTEGKPLFSGRTDITYDPQRRVYRSVTTLAQGAPSEGEGTWDSQSQILSWLSRDPKTNTTTVSRSVPEKDGVELWMMEIKDAGNRVLFQCRGANTRRGN